MIILVENAHPNNLGEATKRFIKFQDNTHNYYSLFYSFPVKIYNYK